MMEEILKKNNNVLDAMKEYAEYYAHKCLEVAAKEAVTNIPSHPQLHMTKNVHKGSITGIKLPNHE
jgi:hypothetical protein